MSFYATSEDVSALGRQWICRFNGEVEEEEEENKHLHWMLTDANGKGFGDTLTLFVLFENY
jgi:hypothetical protein